MAPGEGGGRLIGMVLRRFCGALIVLGTFLLVGVVTPEPACACSCAPVTEREAFAGSEAVFSGRLLERDEPIWPREDRTVDLVFEVSSVNKGDVVRHQRIRTASQGPACGLDLEKGRQYVVFADMKDGHLSASLCGATRRADKKLPLPSHAPRSVHRDLPDVRDGAGGMTRWWPAVVGVGGFAMVLVLWWRSSSAKPKG